MAQYLSPLPTLVRSSLIFLVISIFANFATSEWGFNETTDLCLSDDYPKFPIREYPPRFCCNGTQISQHETPELDEASSVRLFASHHSNGYYSVCQKEVSPHFKSDKIAVYLNGTTEISYTDFVNWKERTVNYTKNEVVRAAILDKSSSLCPEAGKESEFYKKYKILDNCYYSNIEKKCASSEGIKTNSLRIQSTRKHNPALNCPHIPASHGCLQHYQCCKNESLPWDVDQLIAFQLVQRESGQRYEKCLLSVQDFVNKSAVWGSCVEACALNPIDWKKTLTKPEMSWNATQFLKYMLTSVNMTSINSNLSAKAEQQYEYWRVPNVDGFWNSTGWISFADMEKEYKSVNTAFKKSVDIYCRYYLILRGLAGSTIVHVSIL
ncbi:hypothetical protein Fcan01_27750 [Folsomia candida]|uniref:Uncharacterized protein n=1 Tax=Folsomia candida TaxID=158441 RepID=A0A226CYH4_FOLCA|nr:hypothetical protein Fcan01_27750 [Folsomia candida]